MKIESWEIFLFFSFLIASVCFTIAYFLSDNGLWQIFALLSWFLSVINLAFIVGAFKEQKAQKNNKLMMKKTKKVS